MTGRLSEIEWLAAQGVCTKRQLQVLNLWRRGWGYRRIAGVLELDKSTVAEHVRRGKRAIVSALERELAA